MNCPRSVSFLFLFLLEDIVATEYHTSNGALGVQSLYHPLLNNCIMHLIQLLSDMSAVRVSWSHENLMHTQCYKQEFLRAYNHVSSPYECGEWSSTAFAVFFPLISFVRCKCVTVVASLYVASIYHLTGTNLAEISARSGLEFHSSSYTCLTYSMVAVNHLGAQLNLLNHHQKLGSRLVEGVAPVIAAYTSKLLLHILATYTYMLTHAHL